MFSGFVCNREGNLLPSFSCSDIFCSLAAILDVIRPGYFFCSKASWDRFREKKRREEKRREEKRREEKRREEKRREEKRREEKRREEENVQKPVKQKSKTRKTKVN